MRTIYKVMIDDRDYYFGKEDEAIARERYNNAAGAGHTCRLYIQTWGEDEDDPIEDCLESTGGELQ